MRERERERGREIKDPIVGRSVGVRKSDESFTELILNLF